MPTTRPQRGPRPLALVARLAAALALALPAASLAYSPGTGTLLSTDFSAELDADWELGDGNGANPSPWTRTRRQGDWKLLADGQGPSPGSSTLHWGRRIVHPVEAQTVSVAMEYEGDLGTGYVFDLELEQRAEVPRRIRLRIDGGGTISLWRSEGAAMVQQAASAPGLVPAAQRRWLRLAIEPDVSGNPAIRARSWSGGATSEPATWDVQFVDTNVTLERVHRFTLSADGPSGVETLLDDLDIFGDGSIGVASSIRTIHLVEWSHLDIGFTEPPDDIEVFAKTHLDDVLANLAADPDYHWTIETAWWLDRWWERSTEGERQEMLARLAEGRLQLAASYAGLTTTVTGHEQLIRSIYWARGFAREHGVPLRVLIHDDVPGATFAYPELLARSGIDYYVGGMNATFGGDLLAPDHGDRPFWWEGPDGSRVLSWITFDNYAEAFDYGFSFFDTFADLYDKLGRRLPEQEEAGYAYPEFMLIRAFDNHYQNFKARDLVNQWNATYSNPVFVLTTPVEFLDAMRSSYGDAAFPVYTGDFGGAWANTKANAPHTLARVRQAHRDGRAAEALHALARAVDGSPSPKGDIDFMYRRMLEVDEHSGAGGWPGYFTPEQMDRNNQIHLGYATDAQAAAITLLASGLTRSLGELPAGGDAVVVSNTLGRARSGTARALLSPALFASTFRLVERGTGAEIAYQKLAATEEILFRAANVPAFGYRIYDLVPGTPTAPPPGLLTATASSLENDHYVVQIDPVDGSLSSVFHKGEGRELVDQSSSFAFNGLGSNIKSEYDFGGAPAQEPVGSATVTVLSDGPIVAEVRVTRTGTPHVETIYRLHSGEDRVEIENVLDGDQMPYVPKSVDVRAYYLTLPFDIHDFQIRTETTTRFLDPLTDGFARATHFDWHNFEHSMALWDEQGGVMLAVDSVATHHIENLSVFPAATWSTTDALLLPRLRDRQDEYEFEGEVVDSYVIEPGTSPINRYTHHLRATSAAFDPVATSRFGFEALNPLEARQVARRPGNLPDDAASWLTVDASNVLCYTVKTAEVGGDLVVRLTELTGAPTTATISSDVLAFSAADRVEHDEDGGTALTVSAAGVEVPLGAYETGTVRIAASASWAPIVLTVTKDDGAGDVVLSWAGGVSPFTARRADDAQFVVSPATLVDEAPVTTHDDPVLHDGRTYFYLVR